MGVAIPTWREVLFEGLNRRIAFGRVFGGQVVEVVAADDVTSEFDIVILLGVRREGRKRQADSLRQIRQSLYRLSQAPRLPHWREASCLELYS